MKNSTRSKIILILALLSAVGATWAGYYYWDVFVLLVIAFFVWAKKLFTIVGLISLLKKAPLFLLVGGKKMALKLLGGWVLFSFRARFRPVRLIIVRIKLSSRYFIRQIRTHWATMSLWERLTLVMSVTPFLLLIVFLVLFFALIPQAIKGFALKKAQETTAAKVIENVVPEQLKAKAINIEKQVKNKIKQNILPSDEIPD